MKSPVRILISLLSLLCMQQVNAGGNETFDQDIGCIMLHKPGETESPLPIITLGTGEQLRLAFDELGGSGDYYQFTLMHCDAYWQPSNLQQLQYLSGNVQGSINSFSFSRNVLQRYVHYESLVPAADMKILFSGNYLLKVYRNYDESQLIFTRRLMVIEPRFTVTGRAKQASNPEYRFTRHEVDFTVGYKGYTIINPNTDVKAVILQNFFWDNAITLTKPFTFSGTELVYNYEKENTFDAANEFRFFDTRSLRFFSQNVEKKVKEDTITLAYLKEEETRNGKPYLFYNDFDGKAVIENRDGVDVNTDGDYAWYYFTLKAATPFNGDVYLAGQLSNWQLQPEYKCSYSPVRGQYEARVRLKQGYYNYLYAVVDPETKAVTWQPTEGSFFETSSVYTVLVYCKNIKYGHDELLGIMFENSRLN